MRAQMAIHMYIIYIYYQQMAKELPSEYINGKKIQTTTSRLSAQLHQLMWLALLCTASLRCSDEITGSQNECNMASICFNNTPMLHADGNIPPETEFLKSVSVELTIFSSQHQGLNDPHTGTRTNLAGYSK